MKKIVFRADDLGYSEGVNYGIAKSIDEGLIANVGLMVNMDATQHGIDLVKTSEVCMGIHVNISSGKPVLAPHLIPSLIQTDGTFKSSKAYQTMDEDVIYEEVYREVEAQYQLFVEMVGREPAYFDAHAVQSQNFDRAVAAIAKKYAIKHSPLPTDGTNQAMIGTTKVFLHGGSKLDKGPEDCLEEIITSMNDSECHMIIYHPGYLDAYILEHSSLTLNRVFETKMLCSEESRRMVENNQLTQMTYEEL